MSSHTFTIWGIATAMIWRGAAFAAVLACSSAQADEKPQFEPLRLNGQLVRWFPQPNGTVSLKYAIADREAITPEATNCRRMNSPNALLSKSNISRLRFETLVRSAFDSWERAAAIRFEQTFDVANADILIGAQSEPVGYAFTSVLPGTRTMEGFREISKSAICLNPEKAWKDGRGGDAGIYDITYTLKHEIGHVIGLDHPSSRGHLMSFRYTEDLAGLTAGDIAGAHFMYGPPSQIQASRVSLP